MTDLMVLISIGLKTSLVVAAAGLLSLALRRQSAAFGHVVWTVALALCVLMPLGVLVLPSHEVAVLQTAHTLPLPRARGREWEGVILAMWLAGTSLVLLRELLAAFGLSRWRRHAAPLTSTNWLATLARVGFDHQRLQVLESKSVASPCTWGFVRPVLLLPTAGDSWPESARYAALMHELAHIERRDAVSILVARLACAVYWFNPLVWLAAERIRSLQERACDDAVLRAGATPSDYAQFLLDVAASHTSGARRFVRALGMTHGSSLRTRIVAILDPQATRSRPRRIRVAAVCASLFAVTMLLATITVAVEPPPAPQSPPPETPTLPEIPTTPETPVMPIQPVPPIPPIEPIPPIDPIQ
jgi:beta-lactamase regulating signal transducer with metallopeptidase domain